MLLFLISFFIFFSLKNENRLMYNKTCQTILATSTCSFHTNTLPSAISLCSNLAQTASDLSVRPSLWKLIFRWINPSRYTLSAQNNIWPNLQSLVNRFFFLKLKQRWKYGFYIFYTNLWKVRDFTCNILREWWNKNAKQGSLFFSNICAIIMALIGTYTVLFFIHYGS